jgi:hypothetical protein
MKNQETINENMHMNEEDFNAIKAIMDKNPNLYIEDIVKFGMRTNQIAVPQFYTVEHAKYQGYSEETFEQMCEDVNFNSAIAEVVDEMVKEIEK